MSGRKSFAEFEYTFIFDGHELVYKYSKTDVDALRQESLSIDGKEVIYYDFLAQDGFTLLEGSATLNTSIKNESPISRVKYVSGNSILTDNEQKENGHPNKMGMKQIRQQFCREVLNATDIRA